jgi:hypothetical protein
LIIFCELRKESAERDLRDLCYKESKRDEQTDEESEGGDLRELR